MHVDLYTKSVLTVIAVALSVIAVRGAYAPTPAAALGSGCGSFRHDPCHIKGTVDISAPVQIDTGRVGLPVFIMR
jgi:hypothetical protein